MRSKKSTPVPEKNSRVHELPDGWEQVNLSQISDLIMGQSPPGSTYNTEGVGVPFFQGKADFTEKSPVLRTWCTQPKKFAKSGDILISVRAPVGPTNVADRDCSIGRGLAAIRPKNGIPIEYILYYLKLKESELALSGTGSTFTAIKKEDLANLSIPLPPLAEQQRIVARVEALLSHINAARERLRRVPVLMKKVRQGVLAAACSGRLTEGWREENPLAEYGLLEKFDTEIPDDWNIPETWQWSTISRVCEKVVDCPHSTPKWTQSGQICIRTSEIKPCYLDLSQARYVSEDTYRERIQRLEPKEGDIVYSREGTLGQAAIIPKGVKICLGQRIMLLRAALHCSPFFLMYLVNSPQTLKIVNELTTGSTSPHINVGDVKKFPVSLPPLAEQHEIVRRVNALFARADAVEREVADATNRAEAMTQAVLGKAFSGKL
jgi:type I restriction enzyme S subunit